MMISKVRDETIFFFLKKADTAQQQKQRRFFFFFLPFSSMPFLLHVNRTGPSFPFILTSLREEVT